MKRAECAALILSFLAAPSMSAAQLVNAQQTFQGGSSPGGPLPAAPFQGAPPRDQRAPAQAGTAVVRGRVFAADSGRPLRRARITIAAPELGADNRTTSTSADGRYEIKELPAGRYTVTVNRSGYLRLSYGQRRPFEQGKPLQVADRQVVESVDFLLPRMSLITGRVFDEAAEAISSVQVFAMRTVYFEGRRRLVPVGGGPVAITDDAGQYRILGLAPGSYFVMASFRETWPITEGGTEQVMGYAPTYFPGTTSIADARRITVGLGQEASNTDFALIPGRASTVSGTAVDSQGRPLVGRSVGIMQEYRGPGFGMFMGMPGATVAGDGAFRIKDLAPGEYKLTVRSTTEIGGASVQEAAAAPILITGVDLDNIALTTSAGWSVTGRVINETGEAPNIPRERVRVIGSLLNSDNIAGPGGPGGPPGPSGGPGGPGNPDSGRVKDDWTFSVTGLYGPARLRASLPDGWMMKAILQGGRDLTDTVFDVKGNDTLAGIDIVVSNRVTSVDGQLTDGKGVPLADGTIIVFANEPEKYAEDSRFVRSARPDQQGRWQIKGLPAGEYLAVAVDYVEDGQWNDPEYLESIRRYAQKLALGEGGAQAISLKLVTP